MGMSFPWWANSRNSFPTAASATTVTGCESLTDDRSERTPRGFPGMKFGNETEFMELSKALRPSWLEHKLKMFMAVF